MIIYDLTSYFSIDVLFVLQQKDREELFIVSGFLRLFVQVTSFTKLDKILNFLFFRDGFWQSYVFVLGMKSVRLLSL